MSTFRAKIGPSGRLVIPVPQRRELGLKTGDEVVLRVEDNELHIYRQPPYRAYSSAGPQI